MQFLYNFIIKLKSKHMDKYSLNARIYPIVILLLPLVIIGLSYSIEYESYLQLLSAIGVSAALIYFLSNLGRDMGKIKEPRLWETWGGMPTVQLLSFQNDIIDKHTKRKYHKILLELSPIIDNDVDFETANLESISEIYKSWTKFLIVKTRDIKKFPLVFKENISYGFRRNLWGLKNISLILIVFTILGNYGFQLYSFGFFNFANYPLPFFISESILILLLVIWVFRINSNWIKIPAFAYGERLIESIETL